MNEIRTIDYDPYMITRDYAELRDEEKKAVFGELKRIKLKQRQYSRKYAKSDKGRIAMKKAQHKYHQRISEIGFW